MAKIVFDDGGGSEDLEMFGGAGSISRFNNWLPDPQKKGEKRHGVDGQRYQFPFATHYMASFEMPHIASGDEDLVQRFMLWAGAGGLFEVHTDDSEDNTYDECQLAPDSEITIQRDRDLMEFTLSLTIINMATSPAPMRCVYA